jgi:alpha-amylase/alpha-mannosidase (GH57 family)
MTRVAILWHMHQPFYEDLATGEHILPWVRLHALKDYFGMVALLRQFPDVRMTFNLVPSLLVQLEAFAEDRARDRFLELSLKPADALTDAEALFIVENFFHAQQQRMIDIYPRYAELAARRAASPAASAGQGAAFLFSREELRDLQVWHKLAWIDPSYHESDGRIRKLVEKGRLFSEEDKSELRTVELEILRRVVPEYRDAAARGQIELSTSPFYHPILPLLCDTDIYLRTHPESPMPRRRFVHPEDAAEQLARARSCCERLFGLQPVGLWPSEGSVSDAMIPIAARAGFRWMATDEMILGRTLEIPFTRDGPGHLQQAGRLYRPYVIEAGGATMACVFRDHVLSDLIGFTYSGWDAEAAANDFISRLVEAGRRFTAQNGGGDALVPIILDGENAWEHFEQGGRPFLKALYRHLSSHPELRTVTLSEACEGAQDRLTGVFPGSWIDANFYIWIGHADDRRAWSQLADARHALETAAGVDDHLRAQAREEVLIAEGSDWFWWYGDDHSSAHDLEFDDLFRRHLRHAYRLLQRPVPDELFVTNISTGPPGAELTAPGGLIAPKLDGEETSYFEWLGAGQLEVRAAAGAMHQVDRPPAMLTLVQFGFDRERLFVRLDAVRRVTDLLAEDYELSLKFHRPEGVRFSVRHVDGRVIGSFWDRRPEAAWIERGPGSAIVAAGSVLEVAMPIVNLGISAGDRLAFFVAVYRRDHEVERHPAHRPIEVEVPGADFEARNWTV